MCGSSGPKPRRTPPAARCRAGGRPPAPLPVIPAARPAAGPRARPAARAEWHGPAGARGHSPDRHTHRGHPAPGGARCWPAPAPAWRRSASPSATCSASYRPGLPAPPEPAASLVMRTAAKPDSPPAHRRRRSRMIPAGAIAGGVIVVVGLTVAAILSRPDVDHAANQRASVVTPVPSRSTAPPPTTAPPAPANPAVLVSSNSQGARYNLLSAVNIELVPSSPCWVEIRTGSATGAVVYQGLLRPGIRHPVAAGGPVWLRLGNPPAVAIVINGTPLAPPGQTASQPYDLTFQPATGG